VTKEINTSWSLWTILPNGQKPTYTIPNQEALIVAVVLVTNFRSFGVPRELHSGQGRQFKSCVIQEGLQCLGVSKIRTTTVHLQSDSMDQHYSKTVEEHLRKVFALHQRDWDSILPIFLLA
jgi:hypothetical protein